MSEANIVRHSAEQLDEMIRRGDTLTDWERVRNMTDEEVEASIDHDDEGAFDWSTLRPEGSSVRQESQVAIDIDTMEWFRANAGDEYQQRINAVLRDYVDAERREAS